VVITLGVEPEEAAAARCGSLVMAARVQNPWGVEEERDVPVLLCRSPGVTLQELWAQGEGR
jgi:hypothetical protein